MSEFKIFVCIAGAALAGMLFGIAWTWVRMRRGLRQRIDEATRRGVASSRSTIKGQVAEQMAPLLEGFPYLPSDARFLGDPIDYVVFSGYTRFKDEGEGQVELVIIDIKHGEARLSPTQRAIADAVTSGRVRFECIYISESGRVKVARE